jgi:cation diffusion facilitator CzcD-associated flavoprotein CzcO
MAEDFDIIIIGAGLSGINAAYTVRKKLPSHRFTVLEARDVVGGTWSFWKYPGFRSDSYMTTFGFFWHPWPHNKKMIDGPVIQRYIEDAVKTQVLDKLIRLRHRLAAANWSTAEQRWALEVDVPSDGAVERKTFKAGFVLFCSGYYAYNKALPVDIPGIEDFGGRVVHPQWWPENLEYEGKRVVIIGSGATAVTLVPEIAKTAAHTTMLQRSPSYVFSLTAEHPMDKFLKWFLPLWMVHWICYWKDLFLEILLTQLMLRFPKWGRGFLRMQAAKHLPPGYPIDEHFNPRYDPFMQRCNMCPDGIFFDAIAAPNCEIVTDTIETVAKAGIRTTSGKEIPADIIITATGLYVQLFNGVSPTVDGKLVKVGQRYTWRGCMLDGVPNAAAIIGYTAQSWTPGADAMTRMAIRVMKHMQAIGATSVTPVLDRTGDIPDLPCVPATSTYFVTARERIPKSTNQGPWYGRVDWLVDTWALLFGSMTVGMRYTIPEKGKDK